MKFLSRFRQPAEDQPFTIADAQEKLKGLCEGMAEFHRCISTTYQQFSDHVKAERLPPHTATSHFQSVEPNLSVHLLEPLAEYRRRTEAGRTFSYEDMRPILGAGGDKSNCLPVADKVLKDIASHMRKYREGDAAHEELTNLLYGLLSQRIYYGGKPAPDVVAAMGRGLDFELPAMQRIINDFYRETVTVGNNGKTVLQSVEDLCKPSPSAAQGKA